MFTKCLWGGQSDLTIKEIIESGKYDIKGYYLNYYKGINFPMNITITNQSGYLLYLHLRSPYFYNRSFDIYFTINTGIANRKIHIRPISAYRGAIYYANLDTNDNRYTFQIFKDYNDNFETTLLKSKYTFPESSDTDIYNVISDKDFNVNYFKETIPDVYTYSNYQLMKFTKLTFNLQWVYSVEPNIDPSNTEKIIELVYAIPK